MMMFTKGMRIWLVAAILALSWYPGGHTARAEQKLQPGDFVVICGDSITEQRTYSGLMETYLAACQPGHIRAAQFGWSGDSLERLFQRSGSTPILMAHPTVVTTCYGMNDGGSKPIDDKTIRTYVNGMTRLAQELKQGGVRMVILGSPGVVDTDSFKKAAMYNATLAALRDAARQVAEEQDCIFANVHDPMMDVMTQAKAKYGPRYLLAGSDGVHPGPNGALVMAYAFLKAMGCDGNIGTLTFDMPSGKATATEGHKILASRPGRLDVESSRYPFCFWGKLHDPNATTGIIEFLPFNQDLNRFILIVTGLPANVRVRVTWGDCAKEFKSAELVNGINLAAEFLDTPFAQAFQRIRMAVDAKQLWEATLYKSYLTLLPALQKEVREADPEAATALDRIVPILLKKDANLSQSVAAQVIPVKHTLQIEVMK